MVLTGITQVLLLLFEALLISVTISTDTGESRQTQICDTGVEQSPVDIMLTPFKPIFPEPTIFILNSRYNSLITHRFLAQYNDRSGAQFVLNPAVINSSVDLKFRGIRLESNYRLASIHFHWGENDISGSEHTVNGASYPLELHMVHHKTSYNSLADAVDSPGDRDAITVFGFFFEVKQIQCYCSLIREKVLPYREPTPVECLMKISDIFPKKLDFVRYFGSLTTGNCEETVLWNVFLRPLKISADQMAAFRRLSNKSGTFAVNYRETFPLNGRSLQFLRAKGLFRDKSEEQFSTLGKMFLNFPAIVLNRVISFLKKYCTSSFRKLGKL